MGASCLVNAIEVATRSNARPARMITEGMRCRHWRERPDSRSKGRRTEWKSGLMPEWMIKASQLNIPTLGCEA